MAKFIDKQVLKALTQKNMIIALLMGFSSGMPLLLTSRTLQAWLTDANVDISTIGLFALVGLPYTYKLLWAPIMDKLQVSKLGLRRGWLLITQFFLILSIVGLGFCDTTDNLKLVAAFCVAIAFFSASQDIVVDAYRRESLEDEELGMGSTLYMYGYRVAMWISGAFSLILADQFSWSTVYAIMASFMLVGIVTTLFAEEPKKELQKTSSFWDAVVSPVTEFFKRNGWASLVIFSFILFYKLGDTIAGSMATTFYLKIGFSKSAIGVIAKSLGMFSTLLGAGVGGLIMIKLGINRSLWIFGILQAVSTVLFAVLAETGPMKSVLALVIGFEDFSGGMGTAAFMAFMAKQASKKFTGFQYAALTSIMALPRTLFSATSGFLAEYLDWTWFFIVSGLLAIPGLLMLFIVAPWNERS